MHRCPPRVSNRAERNGDGPERELGPELMRAEPDAEPDPNFMLAGQIVRELLARTSAYADDGAALSEDEKTRVDILLDMLAKWGIKQRPLEDPALFGNYR